jgi:hypothetical protein
MAHDRDSFQHRCEVCMPEENNSEQFLGRNMQNCV